MSMLDCLTCARIGPWAKGDELAPFACESQGRSGSEGHHPARSPGLAGVYQVGSGVRFFPKEGAEYTETW